MLILNSYVRRKKPYYSKMEKLGNIVVGLGLYVSVCVRPPAKKVGGVIYYVAS